MAGGTRRPSLKGTIMSVDVNENDATASEKTFAWRALATGEWIIKRTSAKQRRVMHYWLTIIWFTVGLVLWIVLRHDLWFVGFMSLYAIWITHLAGWAAETPVESEDESGSD
jgi:uncharacterized membrane protein